MSRHGRRLVAENQAIVTETPNVRGMLRNRRLPGAITDAVVRPGGENLSCRGVSWLVSSVDGWGRRRDRSLSRTPRIAPAETAPAPDEARGVSVWEDLVPRAQRGASPRGENAGAGPQGVRRMSEVLTPASAVASVAD